MSKSVRKHSHPFFLGHHFSSLLPKLATCLPQNQCLPASYLSSASNYWGSDHLESSKANNGGLLPLETPGGAGRCISNQWASGPWGWAAPAAQQQTTQPQARVGMVSTNFPSTNLYKRTSFSCNDLSAMSSKVRRFSMFEAARISCLSLFCLLSMEGSCH